MDTKGMLDVREVYYHRLKKVLYELTTINDDLMLEEVCDKNDYEARCNLELHEEDRKIGISGNVEGLMSLAEHIISLALSKHRDHSIRFDFDNNYEKIIKLSNLKNSEDKGIGKYLNRDWEYKDIFK